MNEPWISNTGMAGGILGSIMGILGGVVGTLAGVLAPKGKAKRLVMGVEIFAVVLSFTLLIIGITAYLSGQPRNVWYCFGYPGLLCLVIFGIGVPVTLKRYRDAELRKAMSEDLTLGRNVEEKEISDE